MSRKVGVETDLETGTVSEIVFTPTSDTGVGDEDSSGRSDSRVCRRRRQQRRKGKYEGHLLLLFLNSPEDVQSRKSCYYRHTNALSSSRIVI